MTDQPLAFRHDLPTRRATVIVQFTHCHLSGSASTFNLCVGFRPDGRIGEVFLDSLQRLNTDADVMAKDLAVLLSLAIQSGMDLKDLRESVMQDAGLKAEGLLGQLLDLLDEVQRNPPSQPTAERSPANVE